uniref:Glycosyltransferase family 92 protein n=1 Tax=Caenorhabditis tropicalis TaxID=1561998 RepID=A0A1I7TYA5_9PELO
MSRDYWVEQPDFPDETSKNYSIQTEIFEQQYCIGYNFLEGTDGFRDDDGLEPITLATHATSDMMGTLEKMTSMWHGPISVGIFIDYHSSQVLEYLAEVHRCDEEFRRKMTIHFAIRQSAFQTSCPSIHIPKSNRTCWMFRSEQDILRSRLSGPFQLYPSNLMRNVARHGAKSDIHFIMDADMIVSEGFAQKVKKIANQMIDGKSKHVLAVRRFESVNGTYLPRTHFELKQSMLYSKTFEFHHRFFPQGHHIDNLEQWFDISERTDEVSTQEIPYAGFEWEVQVILHRSDPYNAAYFPSRIKVMHSLIYALCRADYTFNVLSHVFDVHEGIKHTNTIYSKATIAHQEAYAMNVAGERYINEMNEKYPNTEEKCGKFSMV